MECKEGQVAYITGGASGIGFGMATAFAKVGMKIALADIEEGAVTKAAQALQADGADARPFVVDVTDRKGLAESRDAAISAFGGINLVCNNAGVNRAGHISEISYDDWDWVMGVNLDGVINGAMTFVPELTRQGSDGHMINTASVGGLVGMPSLAIYNTAKFGVVGLSEALRADLFDAGVGISVLCPGLVRTNLNSSERNRPGNEDKDIQAPENDTLLQGMDPMVLGEYVLAEVRAGAFFICPHPEFRGVIGDRNNALEAAFKGDAPQETIDMMRAMVNPF
ncbi:MAG: SDR family NAD(P)-dependent oxidoreductase [Alphaproteobacteria bacterium]|nr:MAG: SDR family NAD(P)-dependent oxidoreductase [Alphaproteobacteria bacterium]